jgi:hypothetical protein
MIVISIFIHKKYDLDSIWTCVQLVYKLHQPIYQCCGCLKICLDIFVAYARKWSYILIVSSSINLITLFDAYHLYFHMLCKNQIE